MGYVGRLEDKLRAQELRKQGLSYSEILQQIQVSKSTLSHWCRDIAPTAEQALRLYRRKLEGAARGRIIGAKKQQQKRLAEIESLLKKGRKEVGSLSKRDRFLIGVALYAAEGDKTDCGVGFANSDSRIIKFMMSWFREFCKVPESKLRGAIWIHDNLDAEKAKRYWSTLTGIPRTQFHKTYIAKNKVNSRKIRKNKHEYGVFSVRFSDSKIHRRLMGWIAGILAS